MDGYEFVDDTAPMFDWPLFDHELWPLFPPDPNEEEEDFYPEFEADIEAAGAALDADRAERLGAAVELAWEGAGFQPTRVYQGLAA